MFESAKTVSRAPNCCEVVQRRELHAFLAERMFFRSKVIDNRNCSGDGVLRFQTGNGDDQRTDTVNQPSESGWSGGFVASFCYSSSYRLFADVFDYSKLFSVSSINRPRKSSATVTFRPHVELSAQQFVCAKICERVGYSAQCLSAQQSALARSGCSRSCKRVVSSAQHSSCEAFVPE